MFYSKIQEAGSIFSSKWKVLPGTVYNERDLLKGGWSQEVISKETKGIFGT